MNDLKFEPKHNLVAVLDESILEADGYRDMIRFLKRSKYVYAMCAKPIVYARLIKIFWRTAEVVTDEAVYLLTALRLDEEEVGAPDEYTTAESQACFMNMGHPPIFPKQQFVRARLGKQWKLLCYVIQQCLSRRSVGFNNFPSDIASPIVAIATNRPFNMSRWIMKGFIFNLVKGKRFKFLMYPRFLQLLINIAHPVIREEGVNGDLLMTEDMNALSYRKMSIGNVAKVKMFDYMRDIVNSEEDIGGIYHHISQDDEEDGNEDDDNNDDENVVDSDEEIVAESESDEAEKESESVVLETPKDITVCYTISRRSETVTEPMIVEEPIVIEEVSVPEHIDVVQIAQEVVAEVETVAQTVDETEVVKFVPDTRDIATSSAPATVHTKQPRESSPKVSLDVNMNEEEGEVFHLKRMIAKLLDENAELKASNERKKKRLAEFWAMHQKNSKIFKELDAEYENLKIDYEELHAECNTLRAKKEVLEKWLKEEEPESTESDKEFVLDEDVGVSETPRDVTVYYTRSRRSKTVTEPIVESVPIPDDAAAIVTYDKAEGKRKLDEVPEIVEEDVSMKKSRTEEAVQVEPVQAETVHITEVMSISDKVDFTDSETEVNVDEEIPIDLDARFAYLERMKYNPVYLNGLTVSQINEEYEKCINAQDKAEGDDKEFVVELGEWNPLQERLNIDDLPPEELYHQNPEEMTSVDMRQWLQSRNYPYKTLKRLKKESLKKIVVSFQASENMHNRMLFLDYNNRQYFELNKSEMKAYHIPMVVRESWHKAATTGDIVRSLLSKGESVADLLDSLIVPEKSKDVKIIAWKYDEVFDAFFIKRVNGLCDVYHYYSSIFKLPVQDLKELHKLRLINHAKARKQEDKVYLDNKKKKQKKLILRDMYLEEFSDEYFDKVTDPGLKVFDGSQKTKPILKFFYHEETFELKLVCNLDDWDQDMITLFSTFELKRSHKMEKMKDPIAEADRKLFEIMIEVIGAATEKIRLRKALLNADLVKINIPEIEFMRITSKGTLEVRAKGKKRPYEFYANIDFAGITLETLKQMATCEILTNKSKPRQAMIAEKFKSCIEEAIKEQEEYTGKQLLNVKEEEL
ncbi:hypothetical protein QVD17_16745 [Tagetes erecta]|uniref:Uncharacterized protein n=1 Tax=Tagetes erecta TaxID=13708 RepID=A0AAD8P0V4_TARER|nr:hypothetical protein QVD17_16745 [Tagetes erecta]